MSRANIVRKFEKIDEKTFSTIMDSITLQELEHPRLMLVPSRTRRIASGSGTKLSDVRTIAKTLVAVPMGSWLADVVESDKPATPLQLFREVKDEVYQLERRERARREKRRNRARNDFVEVIHAVPPNELRKKLERAETERRGRLI